MSKNSQKQEEIVTVDITEGDFNDVYRRGPIVRGTWTQIEEFVKSYFTEEGLKRVEDIGSDGICLAVYQSTMIDENGNEVNIEDLDDDQKDDVEPRIEYYVEASRINDVNGEVFNIVDLTKEQA